MRRCWIASCPCGERVYAPKKVGALECTSQYKHREMITVLVEHLLWARCPISFNTAILYYPDDTLPRTKVRLKRIKSHTQGYSINGWQSAERKLRRSDAKVNALSHCTSCLQPKVTDKQMKAKLERQLLISPESDRHSCFKNYLISTIIFSSFCSIQITTSK